MILLIVGSLLLLSPFVPAIRPLMTYGFIFPVFATLFGCAGWVVWNLATGMEALTWDAFKQSMFLGCIPSLWVVLNIKK